MRDIRPGTVHPIDRQTARYLRKQPGASLRGIPGPRKPGQARPGISPIEAQRRAIIQHNKNLALIRDLERGVARRGDSSKMSGKSPRTRGVECSA